MNEGLYPSYTESLRALTFVDLFLDEGRENCDLNRFIWISNVFVRSDSSFPTGGCNDFLPDGVYGLARFRFLCWGIGLMTSESPSEAPSVSPSETPSAMPSSVPSVSPGKSPSATPSQEPSVCPSATPSESPSEFHVLAGSNRSSSQREHCSRRDAPSMRPTAEDETTPSEASGHWTVDESIR
jgi:hypothetical protein